MSEKPEDEKPKNDIIKSAYTDKAGFGSITKTYKDAKVKDNTITIDNVKACIEKNVENKRKAPGQNSYIPEESHFEYQVDVAFIKGQGLLVLIDTFSKFAVVKFVDGKSGPNLVDALSKAVDAMGHTPKMRHKGG